MLGKIFMVCVLVSVSACLVRPSTSTPQIAGIADDVAALLSKLGAKSTDEAVAKLWAKGDELSKAEQDDLVKLLKSSDGAAALTALQMPVTSKLARLDNMWAEYKAGTNAPEVFRQRMLADMDRTVEEVNAAAARYRAVVLSVVQKHHIPSVEYPARKVLEMGELEGLAHVKLLRLTGTPEDIVAANVLTRDFNNLEYFITVNDNAYSSNKLAAFKKVLTEGNLEKDIFPFYNRLVEFASGTAYTESAVSNISRIGRWSSSEKLATELNFIRGRLSDITRGLRSRRVLLENAGISKARAAEIDTGSLRFLKGAGLDGSETMEKIGMSKWARDTSFLFANKMAKVGKKVASNPEVVAVRQTIEKLLKEIEEMQ